VTLPPPTPVPTIPQLPAPSPVPAMTAPPNSAIPLPSETVSLNHVLSTVPGATPNGVLGSPSGPAAAATPPNVITLPGKPYQLVLPPAARSEPGSPSVAVPPTTPPAEPARRRLFGTKEGRLWNPFGH
jgi:hypothetical protein